MALKTYDPRVEEILRRELNPSQFEAATSVEGPYLVVAGAGTGKTRVIEFRVLWMVSCGIRPDSILLLTFTRRAAREMLSRAARHNRLCEQVNGGTFHSFGYAVVSRYADLLGLRRPLSFLDQSDSEELLSRLAHSIGLTEKEKRLPSKTTLREVISASFNRNESVERVLLREYPHLLEWAEDIERLKEAYVRHKIQHNMLDYDDLLLYLVVLLEDEKVRDKLSDRYRYIMVDEYQDTNHLQARTVYLLGQRHRNVMAVGDDAQSIYGFRGARFENMFEFLEVFPEAKVIKLEDNYRSTQPILDLANSVIDRAKKRHTKVLRAVRSGGEKPRLLIFPDRDAEAEWIARKVKELWDEGYELSRLAVLFRSMYLARPLELALARLGIPYRTYGGLRFTETAHVKDVLAHIRVLVNPLDELAWHRVLRLVDGVGTKTADALVCAIARGTPWRDVFSAYPFPARARSGVKRLEEALREAEGAGEVGRAVATLVDYYRPILEARYDDYPRRQGDLEALKHIARGYRSFEEFLLDLVALEPPQAATEERQDEKLDTHPLVLSTIHSAKGLEWEVVFLMGVADGHLPLSYALEEEELEEERRLLYVAITRARTLLFLTMSQEGTKALLRLSRFLSDPEVVKYLDLEDLAQLKAPLGGLTRGEALAERILHGFGGRAQDEDKGRDVGLPV